MRGWRGRKERGESDPEQKEGEERREVKEGREKEQTVEKRAKGRGGWRRTWRQGLQPVVGQSQVTQRAQLANLGTDDLQGVVTQVQRLELPQVTHSWGWGRRVKGTYCQEDISRSNTKYACGQDDSR